MSPAATATAATSAAAASGPDAGAAYRYHLLRAATEQCQCNIPALNEAQRAAAEAQAQRTFALERLVLGSDEAAEVVIAAGGVEQSLAAIAARFETPEAFHADLARNGLDAAGLRHALRRELAFDAVMQRVGGRHSAVTDTDVQRFYELHAERFRTPERRRARHILITVNADYAENTRDAAHARATTLAAELQAAGDGTPAQRFARLAHRHSECPTAMEGGALGDIVRGQLFPEVDAALFALPAGSISAPVESQMGFHILLCEGIEPARALPLGKCARASARRSSAAAVARRRRPGSTASRPLRHRADPTPPARPSGGALQGHAHCLTSPARIGSVRRCWWLARLRMQAWGGGGLRRRGDVGPEGRASAPGIVRALRDDVADAAARVRHIAVVAGQHDDMQMIDASSRGSAIVVANGIGVGARWCRNASCNTASIWSLGLSRR